MNRKYSSIVAQTNEATNFSTAETNLKSKGWKAVGKTAFWTKGDSVIYLGRETTAYYDAGNHVMEYSATEFGDSKVPELMEISSVFEEKLLENASSPMKKGDKVKIKSSGVVGTVSKMRKEPIGGYAYTLVDDDGEQIWNGDMSYWNHDQLEPMNESIYLIKFNIKENQGFWDENQWVGEKRVKEIFGEENEGFTMEFKGDFSTPHNLMKEVKTKINESYGLSPNHLLITESSVEKDYEYHFDRADRGVIEGMIEYGGKKYYSMISKDNGTIFARFSPEFEEIFKTLEAEKKKDMINHILEMSGIQERMDEMKIEVVSKVGEQRVFEYYERKIKAISLAGEKVEDYFDKEGINKQYHSLSEKYGADKMAAYMKMNEGSGDDDPESYLKDSKDLATAIDLLEKRKKNPNGNAEDKLIKLLKDRNDFGAFARAVDKVKSGK